MIIANPIYDVVFKRLMEEMNKIIENLKQKSNENK